MAPGNAVGRTGDGTNAVSGNFHTFASHLGAVGAEIRAAKRAGLDISAADMTDQLNFAASFEALTKTQAALLAECVAEAERTGDTSLRVFVCQLVPVTSSLSVGVSGIIARLAKSNFLDFPAVTDRVCEFVVAIVENIRAIEECIASAGVEQPLLEETRTLHDAIVKLCGGVRERADPEAQVEIFQAVQEVCWTAKGLKD